MDPLSMALVGGAVILAIGAGSKRRKALRAERSAPRRGTGRAPSDPTMPPPDEAPPTRPAGEVSYIIAGRGVEELQPATAAALQAWAREVTYKTGRKPEITSGYRSPERQAEAMLEKLRQGDDLIALYRNDDLVRRLLDLPHTVEAWAPLLAVEPISDHQSGNAWDVRTRDRSEEDVQTMKATAQAMGLKAIVESKPYHLHIEA